MINRYAGEIHINPVRILRNDDFNNDGRIADIKDTLATVIEINQDMNDRLNKLINWLKKENSAHMAQFEYAQGGYIQIKGLTDDQLLYLESKGLIELFDNATSKEWVKKYGPLFGLIWEDGGAVEI